MWHIYNFWVLSQMIRLKLYDTTLYDSMYIFLEKEIIN